MPLLRSLKWGAYGYAARLRVALPVGQLRGDPTFIVGNGRSGSTILGRIIGQHGSVAYLNEPIHFWHAIDPRTDVIDFFGGKGQCFFDAADADVGTRLRFDRVFGQVEFVSGAQAIVEKLPANALRMAWLRELCPRSRFIHIVRDGRAVCSSVEKLARSNRYKVSGMSGLNQWWGNRRHKWKTFAEECMRRGLYQDALTEIGGIAATDLTAMAAYEWIVTTHRVWESMDEIGLKTDGFLELRYEDLLADTAATMGRIERLIGLPNDAAMLRAADRMLTARQTVEFEVRLPPRLFELFAQTQQWFSYPLDGVRVANAATPHLAGVG